MSEKLERALQIARDLQDDCKADAMRVDETPFTPRGVGGLLGEHLAMIAACARVCEVLAEEVQSLQRILDARTESLA